MPNYNSTQAGGVTAVGPGDIFYLFNAETPTAPQSSLQFARAGGPFGYNETTFSIDFANASPTDSVVIQGANVDSDALYQTLYTSTNKQHDNYTDTVQWNFYRAQLVSGSGGALTVIAKR